MNPLSDLERLVAAIETPRSEHRSHLPRVYADRLRHRQRLRGNRQDILPSHLPPVREIRLRTKRTSYTTTPSKRGNGRNGLGSVFHWAEI